MKYQVFEIMLNEYTDYPNANLIEEIEADSPEEANRIARRYHPNKGALRVQNNDDKSVVEFDE